MHLAVIVDGDDPHDGLGLGLPASSMAPGRMRSGGSGVGEGGPAEPCLSG